MEEIINKLGTIGNIDPTTCGSLTLAYLGDCVYELFTRTALAGEGITHLKLMNVEADKRVCAVTQCKLLRAIEGMLDVEELQVYKRGRNVKTASMAKNATVAEYHVATGFEALVGYLYLKGRTERIIELINAGWKELGII